MKTAKLSMSVICFLFLSVFSGYTQITVPASEIFLDKLRLNKIVNGVEGVFYSEMTGSPYIFKDFCSGKIVLKTGESYAANMRYDIYGDQIHIKRENDIYGLINLDKVSLIVIDTMKFLYSEIAKPGNNLESGKSGYFIIMSDGKCKLLARKNIRIQDAEPPKPYQEAKPAKFVHLTDSYYLKMSDGKAVLISSKNDLLSIMSDKKDAVSSFMKTHKYGVKNIKELVEIVSFYNKL